AQGLLLAKIADAPGSLRTDLIASYEGNEAAWEFGSLLKPRFILEGGSKILELRITGTVQVPQPIAVELKLKPRTAYILEVELRSPASFDLVRFPDLNIPDSYPDSWNKDLAWSHYKVAFITPDWLEGEKVVTMELARVYDKDFIRFRALNLVELAAGEVAP
ncbi:MAG: hypothetical protein WD740_09040, partial [Anaerolineales bacterium]